MHVSLSTCAPIISSPLRPTNRSIDNVAKLVKIQISTTKKRQKNFLLLPAQKGLLAIYINIYIYIYGNSFVHVRVVTLIFINYIVYVFILVYQFEYVYILILRYSGSYHAKIFQKKIYFRYITKMPLLYYIQ